MLAFLAVYHLFLEKEKMHRFNRFYLLFALAFSISLPFITIELVGETATVPVEPVYMEQPLVTQTTVTTPVDYTTPILWSLYAAITLLLTVKFAKNIHYFTKQVRKNQSQKLEDATLVLLEEKVIPHTFLNYIFVSKEEHQHNSIEQELYTHELAHVRQKHSLDVLFIEVLKTVLWFNPLLYFYKKAIQLNHEFLADETVVTGSNNIIDYQKLLLQKAVPATNYQLASSLNFSVTKKRFKMMTKATPKRKALLLKLAALPVIAGLIFVLCTETVAQTVVSEEVEVVATVVEVPKSGNNDPERDSFYAGVQVVIHNDKGEKIVNKPYEQLTEAEKDKYLPPAPQPAKKRKLSAEMFESLKDSKKYKVSIDNVPVDNKELGKFKPKDFAIYTNSPALTDALTGKLALPQYMLYTNNYFETKVKNFHKKYEYDSYVVYVGHPIDLPLAGKETEITAEKIAAPATNDTVKKTREQQLAEAQARKATVMDERGRVMAMREEMATKRNTMAAERDVMAAQRDSMKSDKNLSVEERRKAIETMRELRKIRREEIAAKKAGIKTQAIYQEGKVYPANEVTVQPEYPGGITAFYADIAKELKTPAGFAEKTVKVYVSFIIETNGSISTIKILRQPDGVNLRDEAVKALNKTKKWSAATVQNKAVRCSYNIPIVFEDKK